MTGDSDNLPQDYPNLPWEDVQASRRDRALQRRHGMTEHREGRYGRSCPKCGAPSKDLVWIYFRSPAETWRNLCGTEGVLRFCEPCQQCVDYEEECLS